MNNMFISYDLIAPDKNYERVITAIKELAPNAWARVTKSFWYVRTPYNAEQAKKHVSAAMDRNDVLCVVNATDNSADFVNLAPEVEQLLRSKWNSR